MNRSCFLRSLVFTALFSAGVMADLEAQNPSDPASDISAVQPTVTPEMGDPGGKSFGRVPDPARTRHYYIAAEPELWNFAPDGQDPICSKAFPPSLLLNRVSWMVRYVQYADADFTARVLPAERLGVMGPVMRGIAGDYIAVTFLNRAWLPLSIHPHGVKYDKDNEGSFYKPSPGRGAAIAPGAKFTYVWQLDEASAPRPDEPSSKAWLYHSHVNGDEEINLGLVGCIIVTDPARARPDGTPRDVDREMTALFKIFDEGNLTAENEEEPDEKLPNAAPLGSVPPTWAEVQQFAEEGQRHTINGRVFGNLAGLEMNEGERVRWYVFGLGSENDFHTAHWHGLRVLEDGRRRTDVIELLPASMKVADMQADNPGQWLLHCHVADHMEEGMFARVTVHPAGSVGVSSAPETAFFGMPQALATLRLRNAEVTLEQGPSHGEINLSGQVTVPDPFPTASHAFTVRLGDKAIVLHPDASGISVVPEGILLVKNTSLHGTGAITGGILNFELTLRGAGWMEELRKQQVVVNDQLVPNAALHLDLQVGEGHHTTSSPLKVTPREK